LLDGLEKILIAELVHALERVWPWRYRLKANRNPLHKIKIMAKVNHTCGVLLSSERTNNAMEILSGGYNQAVE
jgi:hypothetical protein